MNKKNNARMSDEAVQATTGKTWQEWFKILDAAGAKKMSHKAIVAFLNQKYDVSTWWKQMVTVTYEQARGMREKHEKPGGDEVSASKTIAVPVATLFKAWQHERLRARWLPEQGISIRKATPGKSMRITWVNGASSVSVNFYKKGKDKTQVTVQHDKLANASEAKRMKAYWQEKVAKLQELLES
jgi:hypothetical protein